MVLTVPASFDEEARELTVAAAREAGIEKLTLLEEPAAAFYSWIANDLARSQKSLFDGQTVLVCDVGGGTSDFTLIRVAREGRSRRFHAHRGGQALAAGRRQSGSDAGVAGGGEARQDAVRSGSAAGCAGSARRPRSGCSRIPILKSVEITVLGGGSSLVGGTLQDRDPARRSSGTGARRIPAGVRADRPARRKKRRARIASSACPTLPIPAVTRHLAAFLDGAGDARPDAILFNGGFFIPEILRQRVADVMEHWYGRRPVIFENRDLDLAVAVGAAYYSYVRATGAGLLVRGGSAARVLHRARRRRRRRRCEPCAWCRAAPKKDRRSRSIPGICNWSPTSPCRFRLYSSRTRTEDQAGRRGGVSRDGDEELHLHAPLNAVLRFGKAGERLVPVKLGAKLTEVGTLEIWADSKESEHRWRLQFELRKAAAARDGRRVPRR